MNLNPLSSVYGAAATWRRRWYERDPRRRRRLGRPVISVGNLRVGGSGKTPVVAHLARLLLDRGERPAILTRGYARTRPSAGVTVVSDGATVLAGVAAAGDEPLMLARALPGVVVLVGANRFESGELGEHELGVTVHVLDDGFQHVALARDIDLVVVGESDLNDHVLPAGSLREPLRNATAADAVLVPADETEPVARVARALGVSKAFRVSRSVHTPRPLGEHPAAHTGGARVVAFAGIARPDRFFADLAASGRAPVDTLTFSDHHPYSQRDIDQIADRAMRAGASELLTTEKDAVRLEGLNLGALRIAVIPLTATIEPADQFAHWFFDRLAAVHREPGTSHPAPRTPHQE